MWGRRQPRGADGAAPRCWCLGHASERLAARPPLRARAPPSRRRRPLPARPAPPPPPPATHPAMLLLFETAAGFCLFKVLNEGKLKEAEAGVSELGRREGAAHACGLAGVRGGPAGGSCMLARRPRRTCGPILRRPRRLPRCEGRGVEAGGALAHSRASGPASGGEPLTPLRPRPTPSPSLSCACVYRWSS